MRCALAGAQGGRMSNNRMDPPVGRVGSFANNRRVVPFPPAGHPER